MNIYEHMVLKMTPKEVIKLIKEQRLSAGEGNLKTLAGAIDRLQKAFKKWKLFGIFMGQKL
jgi:hypothetical protein